MRNVCVTLALGLLLSFPLVTFAKSDFTDLAMSLRFDYAHHPLLLVQTTSHQRNSKIWEHQHLYKEELEIRKKIELEKIELKEQEAREHLEGLEQKAQKLIDAAEQEGYRHLKEIENEAKTHLKEIENEAKIHLKKMEHRTSATDEARN